MIVNTMNDAFATAYCILKDFNEGGYRYFNAQRYFVSPSCNLGIVPEVEWSGKAHEKLFPSIKGKICC